MIPLKEAKIASETLFINLKLGLTTLESRGKTRTCLSFNSSHSLESIKLLWEWRTFECVKKGNCFLRKQTPKRSKYMANWNPNIHANIITSFFKKKKCWETNTLLRFFFEVYYCSELFYYLGWSPPRYLHTLICWYLGAPYIVIFAHLCKKIKRGNGLL